MITKEEILEKHLKTMLNRSDESYEDISEMKKTPEWEVTLNAMQEYADANQMIDLENTDKQWIKLCKGHYQKEYPYQGTWINTLKLLFIKLYGWNPDEDNNYHSYLNIMFNRLLEIHLKIVDDKSGTNRQMRDIFNAAFYKGISRTEELPIERAIIKLCGLIQCNQVIEDNVHRYELD